jgi:hypothetical protein
MPYADPIKPVSAKYGAPMGRYTGPEYLDPGAGPIYLRRIPLNAGGSDAGGAYWGLGKPLFCAQDQDGNTITMRAKDRQEAKTLLRADYGAELRFYR